MSRDGAIPEASSADQVLTWPGRVVSSEELRCSLNGHRALLVSPRTVITPLALEELRARQVEIRRREPEPRPASQSLWGYAQDRPHPLVQSAVRAVQRDGLVLKELAACNGEPACRWARAVAECVARGECQGGVIFCQDPALACCVANKVAGLRAAAVTTVDQSGRAVLALGPNLVAVEMPGRTFFEIRQILRTLCVPGAARCPPGVACTLKELDGHAHR
jgi:hypothetical protein